MLGTALEGCLEADALTIVATLQGATGGTLDVYLQTSFDGGTTWHDFAHFPQLAAAAASSVRVWKVLRSEPVGTLTTIGTNTTPALAANTVIHAFGDRVRALCVAGGGTSLGAAQSILVVSHTQ